MAEILNEFPRPVGRRGRGDKYDWDTWFDGKIRRLTRPDDFDSDPKNFRITIQDKARSTRFNGRAVTQLEGEKSIVVQFVKNS